MHRRSSFPFLFLLVFLLLLRGPCAASPIQDRADRFLKLANAGYQALFRVNSEAQWLAVTTERPGPAAPSEQRARLTPPSMATRPFTPKRAARLRKRRK